MMQKLRDFMLQLQGDRKTQIIVGVVVLVVLVFFVFSGGHNRNYQPRLAKSSDKKTQMRDQEAYQDLVQRLTPDIDQLKAENKKIQDDLGQQNQRMKEYEERTAEIFKKLLERMADQQPNQSVPAANSDMPSPPPTDLQESSLGGSNQLNNQELQQFGEMNQQDIMPPPQAGPQKVAFVGAGDSIRVKLLAGVNAPTDGTPYPVVLKCVSDVYGPDGSQLPLGEARIIAAAQGSLTDSRALFRLTSINLRLPDGRRVVKRVDGWIVGEDGIRGMPGVLVDPLGKALGGALMAGTVKGIGQGIVDRRTTVRDGGFLGFGQTVTVTGNPWEYAAGRGLREGADEWSDIIKERLRQMVPVVQVLSGREATAVFAKSMSVLGLYETLMNGDESTE